MKKNNTKNEKSKKVKRGRPTKAEEDVVVRKVFDNSFDDKVEIETSYSPIDINQGIFDRLTKYIATHGHTYYHLGKKVKVSHNYFSNIKKNNSSIGSEIIARILYYYQDLSADWLLLGEGEMSRSAKSEWDSKKFIERNREIEKLHVIIEESKKQSEILYRQALTVKRLSENRTETLRGNSFERTTQRFIDKLNQEAEEQQEYFPENDDAVIDFSGVEVKKLQTSVNEIFSPTTLKASKKAIETIGRIVGTELFEQLYEYEDGFRKNYELLKKLLS